MQSPSGTRIARPHGLAAAAWLFALTLAALGCDSPGGGTTGGALDSSVAADSAADVAVTDSVEPADSAAPVDTSTQTHACSATNCEGCCDAAGVCRLGLDDDRCGAGGDACADCGETGGSCHDGACETLSCELAASAPDSYPCNFCAPDGSAVVHCGFCHIVVPAPDQLEACDAGTRCYAWDNPISSSDWPDVACLAEPPEACDPASFVDRCDGEVAVNCNADGRVFRDACADYPGTSCGLATAFDGSQYATCLAR